jgi:hypothetical protein
LKLFLKYIGEFLRTYPQVRFAKSDQIPIQKAVLNHLGLTNLNQMRDRYEGQAFFEKTMKNIGGLMALQKHLNMKPIELDKTNLNDFQPYIKLNGEKIKV